MALSKIWSYYALSSSVGNFVVLLFTSNLLQSATYSRHTMDEQQLRGIYAFLGYISCLSFGIILEGIDKSIVSLVLPTRQLLDLWNDATCIVNINLRISIHKDHLKMSSISSLRSCSFIVMSYN